MLFVMASVITSSLVKYIWKDKTSLPYSFLLILIGIMIHYTNSFIDIIEWNNSIEFWQNINPHSILLIFIPPLIYNSASHINFHVLRQYYYQILVLIVPGVLLSSGLISVFARNIIGFKWTDSMLLGVILSATDPVAVTSILENLHISEKIRILIEGESLFNDGTVYVIFSILLSYRDDSIGISTIIAKIFYIPIASVLIGLFMGGVLFIVIKNIYNDEQVEISLSIITCYTTFYISDNVLGLSGILSVVIIGLFIAWGGKTAISYNIRYSMTHVWYVLDFTMNNFIFILTGLIGVKTAEYNIENLMKLVGLYLVINISRFIMIFTFYPLLKCDTYKIYHKELTILSLSGLRGAITLTLALITKSNDILFYSAGIVFLTIPLNSIMVKLYIQYGLNHKYHKGVENLLHIREKLHEVGKDSIENIQQDFYLKNVVWEEVNRNIITQEEMLNDTVIIDINDTLIESRLIYLKTFKQTLWSLFGRNMIYRNTLIMLLELIDSAMDSADKRIILTDKNCNLNHKWYEGLCFSERLKHKFLYHKINYQYNMASAYVLGQKYTLENLSEIMNKTSKIYMRLVSESNESMCYCIEFLRCIEKDYSEITKCIETKQTIHYILKNQAIYLKSLFKNGEINYYIYQQMNKEINRKLYFE
jgi:NhaP-type Na+/H+ or K+/H+ antiporter